MRLAMIGLGRMGVNIARRLMRGGHEIVAFDRNASAVEELVSEGAITAASLEEVAGKLESQRIFWVMLSAGPPTEGAIETLMRITSPGDIIIDGGNSFYRDDIRRATPRRYFGARTGLSELVWYSASDAQRLCRACPEGSVRSRMS